MYQFQELENFNEAPTTYHIAVQPRLVPLKSNGSMNAQESVIIGGDNFGAIIWENQNHWFSEQLAVTEGRVVAMGPKCGEQKSMGNAPPCEIGDVVRFKKFAGDMISIPMKSGAPRREDGAPELIMYINDVDVLAVVDATDVKEIPIDSIKF